MPANQQNISLQSPADNSLSNSVVNPVVEPEELQDPKRGNPEITSSVITT